MTVEMGWCGAYLLGGHTYTRTKVIMIALSYHYQWKRWWFTHQNFVFGLISSAPSLNNPLLYELYVFITCIELQKVTVLYLKCICY